MVGGTPARLFAWWMLVSLLVSGATAAATGEDAEATTWLVGLADPATASDGSLGAKIVSFHPASGFVVVETSDPTFPQRAAEQPGVRYVEANGFVHASGPTTTSTDATNQTEGPNDPFWPEQYGPRQVGALDAWNVTRGDPAVHLCIVDSGIAPAHDDIPSERITAMRDLVEHDDLPQDGTGHGTHVASIAAARTDNTLGIAGLSDVSLLVVRVLDDTNRGTWAAVAAGIEWCTLNGGPRTVINLSLGGSGDSQAVSDAVALAHDNGHLVIAAAGNRACDDCVDLPARIPQVVAVGCTDAAAARCTYSAGGDTLDLVAPGDAITAADPMLGTSGYSEKTGTSMSTPHVSAAAALVWSHHPDLPGLSVAHRLVATAAELGATGFDTAYGHGLLDMPCALLCPVTPPVAPEAPTVSSTPSQSTFRIAWDVPDDPWSEYIEGYRVYVRTGEETARLIATTDADTHHIHHAPPLLDDGRYHVAAVNSGGTSALSDPGCRPLVWTPMGQLDHARSC
ncbi:MAG: S8 family serine peptidase [Euryarchaeota archaeon]|nr:S8 family serine peptidase [Euryarchaeota archaeon]